VSDGEQSAMLPAVWQHCHSRREDTPGLRGFYLSSRRTNR